MKRFKVLLYTSLIAAICVVSMPLNAIAIIRLSTASSAILDYKIGFPDETGMLIAPKYKIDQNMIIPGNPNLDTGIFASIPKGK